MRQLVLRALLSIVQAQMSMFSASLQCVNIMHLNCKLHEDLSLYNNIVISLE